MGIDHKQVQVHQVLQQEAICVLKFLLTILYLVYLICGYDDLLEY